MSLLDILPAPLKNFCTTLYGNYIPLSDPTERQYYEIVYGLLSAFGGFNFTGIKRYVEHCLGTECDEAKLKDALNNFDDGYSSAPLYYLCSEAALNAKASSQGFTKPKVDKLRTINKEIDAKNSYRCTKEEALNICYSEELASFKADFEKAIESAESKKYFYIRQGLRKLQESYEEIFDKKFMSTLLHNLAVDTFMEGNKNMESVATSHLFDVMHEKQNTHIVAAVALRALRFGAFKGNKEDYTSITEEDCRALVLSYRPYTNSIAKSSDDKETVVKRYVDRIKETDVFYNIGVPEWMPDIDTESYFSDAVCYAYWQQVAEEAENDSTDPCDVCDLIWSTIELTEEEYAEREAAERERWRRFEERERERQEQVRQQRQEYAQAQEKRLEELHKRDEERDARNREAQIRREQEADQRREELRKLDKDFYVLYVDQYGKRQRYVNSYKNAHISSLSEVEQYWTRQFNPAGYSLTFVKATESRLEFEQWN